MKWEDSKWKGVLVWYPVGNWECGKKLQLWYEYDGEAIVYNYSRALNKRDSWCLAGQPVKQSLPKNDGNTVVIKLKDEEAKELVGGASATLNQKKLILSILLNNKDKIDKKRPKNFKHFYHYFKIDGLTVKADSYFPKEEFVKQHRTFKKFEHVTTKAYKNELLPKHVKEGYVEAEDEDWLEIGLFSKHPKIIKELR